MSIIRDGFQSADLDVPVVLPTLNLDFANSQELDPRITFSRGSIGTFVNKNGLIETAPANQPRFDYDPISGECRGLLIEESRANLLTSSNSFGAGTVDFGITASAAVSPDGTTNASKMFEKTTNGYKLATLTYTAVSGTTYCGSLFVKAGERSTMFLKITQPGDTGNTTFTFNMNTGVISGVGGSPTNYGAIKYPNGWWRIYLTNTPTSTTGYLQFFLRNDTSGALTYQGDGSSGYYIYGAQVETGSFPTSYIPTSGSTVTRSADNADMTGSNFTSWANSSVGTFVIRGRGGQSTTQTLRGRFVGLDVTASAISLDGASTKVAIWDGGTNIVVTNNSADVVNKNSNIAASFDGTLRRIVLNGVASSGISRRNINTIFTQISLGKNGSNNNYLNGTLSRVAYYPRQLNDAQMLYLTT